MPIKLEDKLENRSIKPTAMRLLVLKFFTEQSSAVSLKKLEEGFEKADKSTLYRTLKTFEESKLIHSIDDGSGMLKYGLCTDQCECAPQEQHSHFHCVQCEETFCLTSQYIPTVSLPTNFTLQQANLVVKGICGNCNL